MDRTTSSTPLVDLKANADRYGWQIRNDSGTFINTLLGSTISNQWQHLTLVREYGVKFRFYVDGVEVNFFNESIGALTAPVPRFGSHIDNGQYFQGMMDEIAIYNRALTAEEIAIIAMVPEISSIILLLLGASSYCFVKSKLERI